MILLEFNCGQRVSLLLVGCGELVFIVTLIAFQSLDQPALKRQNLWHDPVAPFTFLLFFFFLFHLLQLLFLQKLIVSAAKTSLNFILCKLSLFDLFMLLIDQIEADNMEVVWPHSLPLGH